MPIPFNFIEQLWNENFLLKSDPPSLLHDSDFEIEFYSENADL